jgi:PAS domain S-box-containing protein
MSEEVSTPVDVVKLPNLAPRIITVVLIVCLVLLLGQWMQDKAEQQENLDFKKISLYYQQLDFVGQINNSILILATNENESTVGIAQDLLRMSTNQLGWTQNELLLLAQNELELDKRGSVIANEMVQIIRFANEALAEVEAGNESNFRLGEISQILLSSSQHNQAEISHHIDQLTSQLHAKNEENRYIDWWITVFIILLVIVVSLGIYWRGKRQVHRQFNELNELKNRLEFEGSRAKESKQKLFEDSKQYLAQQMKLSSILNSTVDAIITITADGTIDSFNKAAETMFGYSADVVIGKNIKILMPEPYSSKHDGYLKHYRETGEKKIIGQIREVVGKRIDGSEFPLNLSVSEVKDSAPKIYTGIIRDITKRKEVEAKLEKTLAELTQKQLAQEEEERIARHVFENITASNNDIIPEVSSWCEPMGAFSGDMMLSAILPSGGIRIILCDFTGHGLPAALGAVPVSTIHSAMAKKGLPLEILMNELNNKLNELLPTGIFCCIAGIDLDAERTHAQIWNAGLPEVLVVNQTGEITQRIVSNHLPLGVVSYNKNELHCREIQLGAGDSIYALSDGLTEAESEAGDMFGQQRFEQLLMNETDEHGRLTDIRNSIGKFVGQAAPTDDVSLIEIKTLVTTD